MNREPFCTIGPTTNCPFCNSAVDSRITANDGGSLNCRKCGLFHFCANGPRQGLPGPLLCPECLAVRGDPTPVLSQTRTRQPTCPFCNLPTTGWIAQDGGSQVCSQCGPFHHCVNGPRKGSPGPAICPSCRASGRPQVHEVSTLVAICDGCGINIYNRPDRPGERWKCRDCDDFDFCRSCVISKQHNNRHSFYNPHDNPTLFGLMSGNAPKGQIVRE